MMNDDEFFGWEHVCKRRATSNDSAESNASSIEEFAPLHATSRAMAMPSLARSASASPANNPFEESTVAFTTSESVYRRIRVHEAAPKLVQFEAPRKSIAASLETSSLWCEKIVQVEDEKELAVFSSGGKSSLFAFADAPVNSDASSLLCASPHPFYLAPYTSTTCCGKIESIVEALDEYFAAAKIDVSFRASGAVWDTLSYCRNHCLSATITIFEPEEKAEDNFVVEVQRVKGCAFQFAAFYKAIKSVLASHGLTDCAGCGGGVRAAPAAKRAKTRAESADDVIDFRPIVDMARSQYADVQEQALLLIAAEASKPCPITQAVLTTTPMLLDTVVDLLESPHADIHRCAAAAFCSLCTFDANICKKIMKSGGVKKLLKLREMSGICRETERQVTAALAQICPFANDADAARIHSIVRG